MLFIRILMVISVCSTFITYSESISTPGPDFGPTSNLAKGRECGSFAAVSHLSLDDRIRDVTVPLMEDIGGIASLHDSDTDLSSATHLCGAVLISERYLLTAAHCMNRDAGIRSISLGRNDLNEDQVPGSEVFKIEAVYLHPAYLPARHRYNDVAIIRTDRRVQYSKNVFPMCLPASNQVHNDFSLLQIAGWGQVNGSHTSSTIQSAYVKLVENSRCESLWLQRAPSNYNQTRQFAYPDGFTNKLLCAGGQGVDACNGDSGGPLSFQDGSGRHTVIGLIARGFNCPLFPLLPGFYTSLVSYVDWIYETTAINKPLAHNNAPQHIAHTSVVCPEGDGFIRSAGSSQCFRIIKARADSWEDAQKVCISEGLALAEPTDEVANTLRKDLLDIHGLGSAWVAARGDGYRIMWQRRQTELKGDNPLWASDDPDSRAPYSCVALVVEPVRYSSFPEQPYWDESCSFPLHPLCEVITK